MNIEISIDVAKIDKNFLRTNKKGIKFLDIKTKEKPTEYSDGFVSQVIPKHKRQNGVWGPIVGNYKDWDKKVPWAADENPMLKKPAPKAVEQDEDDLPF